MKIPLRGFGTYKLQGARCQEAVKRALEVGYRHIDTALIYENQEAIGQAIESFPREQLFITSKVWNDQLTAPAIRRACDRALSELQTDYLDLWLIHWPNPDVPIKESLHAMARLQEEGRVVQIGVSNFTIPLLEEALATKIPFSVNQVEINPYRQERELLHFCAERGIHVTAYTPLARGRSLEEGAIRLIAKRHGKEPSQVVLRWLEQQGISAIPKASTLDHIRSNFAIDGFTLDEEELAVMAQLDGAARLVS